MQFSSTECNGMKWYGWMKGTCSIYSRSRIREITAYLYLLISFHYSFSSHY